MESKQASDAQGEPNLMKEEIEQSSNSLDRDTESGQMDDKELQRRLRRIYWKVDLRLIPILGALYAVSGIDRINLSSARVAGMHEDLHFYIGNRYSVVLLVFFITYFMFEIPSNIILRKVGAAIWLSFIAMSWGIVIMCAGFVKTWGPLIAIRLLLGLFEAGFFPGCMYLISCWYRRYQIQQRIAWFYSINVIANGFGSLLAYGIIQMEGLGGLRGWRWIFVIEGLLTCVLAMMGYYLIIDFPDKLLKKKSFLTAEEVELIKAELDKDRGDAVHDPITPMKVLKTLSRWQLWIYSLLFMCVAIGIYGYAFFGVVILQGMGHSPGRVFLLSAPPAIASVPFSLVISYLADRTKLRSPYVAFMAITCTIGYLLVAYPKQNGVRYFGVFLGLAGANGALPAVLAWQANNIRGQSTRAIASGLQVAFGAVGGIYASVTFLEREAPTYFSGLWAGIAAQLFMLAACIGMSIYHYIQNRKAARGEMVIEGLEGFRYTY
ncbi:hypothetical protein D8B26_001582 [Coccidioides posadasii str. Silveira]|uniref:Uncharacterized protein n=2 Tax=Coccidioides posadasii TaxID=199306 RepID=E9CVP8_COCPS|nr:conserved hypothetical protein [Coccidioides posadasii str. Silveira]KMM64845.1 hypothetical protein CPAG_01197 [Coccidioides posadasii RMSCC 3488]QVM06879.1 hypothetical protein D8B26_001582 [Coccidioides posadasii str. Silveira]